MSIEEDIKQSKFKNPYQKLAVNIMYTHSWLINYLQAIFKAENITNQQYNILRILRGSQHEPLSTMQIRERMMDKMSDTSRMVDRLVLKRLVTKRINPDDNRLVEIRITHEGLHLLSRLDGIEDKIAQLLNNLSTEEALQASNLLDKIRSKKPLP